MKPFAILLLLSASAMSQDLTGSFRGFAALSQKGGDPSIVVPPHDAGAGAEESDSGETAPVSRPAITIISPKTWYCQWCDRHKNQDWSGFHVNPINADGYTSYPVTQWEDSSGITRQLVGLYRPDQVLWSWQRTQEPQQSADAAQAPTPYAKIAEGLELAGLKPGQSFADIGCGDGRALMIAAEQFQTSSATGVEIDPQMAALASKRLAQAGVSERTEVIVGDATKIDLPSADVAYVYLYPGTLTDLKPQLEQKYGTVVSYLHQVPGMPMQKRGDFYVWRKPQPTVLRSAIQQHPVAVWGGRQYSGPVCNSPGCRMCASIRSQLYGRR